jgi:hypothetical protein
MPRWWQATAKMKMDKKGTQPFRATTAGLGRASADAKRHPGRRDSRVVLAWIVESTDLPLGHHEC